MYVCIGRIRTARAGGAVCGSTGGGPAGRDVLISFLPSFLPSSLWEEEGGGGASMAWIGWNGFSSEE